MYVGLLKAIKRRLERNEKLQIELSQSKSVSFSDYLLNMTINKKGNKNVNN